MGKNIVGEGKDLPAGENSYEQGGRRSTGRNTFLATIYLH